MKTYTVDELTRYLGGTFSGDGAAVISRVNELTAASRGDLAFADGPSRLPDVLVTNASAVIVWMSCEEITGKTLIHVANPRLAFAQVLALFNPSPFAAGTRHPSAVIAKDVQLGELVTVAECAVIRSGATIGRGTVIESGVHVGESVTIGEQCVIHPNVVVYPRTVIGNRVIIHGGSVIGGDGFGYVPTEQGHLKVPQVGNVVIEDDVEIGCNVCVDRATLGSTIIKRGTKIDNLVQIAHNDVIGEDVVIAGQVGLSGSVRVGNRVMFGGQAGVVDHITIGEGARIGAATPVTKDVPPHAVVWGFPARAIRKVKRELAALSLLPAFFKRTAQRLERLERTLPKEHPAHSTSEKSPRA